jgi:hypothetical protein
MIVMLANPKRTEAALPDGHHFGVSSFFDGDLSIRRVRSELGIFRPHFYTNSSPVRGETNRPWPTQPWTGFSREHLISDPLFDAIPNCCCYCACRLSCTLFLAGRCCCCCYPMNGFWIVPHAKLGCDSLQILVDCRLHTFTGANQTLGSWRLCSHDRERDM